MNTNLKAIAHLENNEYEEALRLFRQAVTESREVQSLNNLAWIYATEEEDDEAAMELLNEVFLFTPSSYFPYSLAGEIHARASRWQEAECLLLQSIKLEPSLEAYNNLGVAYYHLGQIRTAAEYFVKGADRSDYAMYTHIKCLIELGELTEAERKLDAFSTEDDDYVGELEVAELYAEMGCFDKAIHWYRQAWENYYKQPVWVNRYMYSLIQFGLITEANNFLKQALVEKEKELSDSIYGEFDETWTESEKKELTQRLLQEKKDYVALIESIQTGSIKSESLPFMKFETSLYSGCYLFGCQRHNHPEYTE